MLTRCFPRQNLAARVLQHPSIFFPCARKKKQRRSAHVVNREGATWVAAGVFLLQSTCLLLVESKAENWSRLPPQQLWTLSSLHAFYEAILLLSYCFCSPCFHFRLQYQMQNQANKSEWAQERAACKFKNWGKSWHKVYPARLIKTCIHKCPNT